MKDLIIFASGFIGGITLMGVLILLIDNREWVKDLKKKHNIGGYQPENDVKSSPPQARSGVPSKA